MSPFTSFNNFDSDLKSCFTQVVTKYKDGLKTEPYVTTMTAGMKTTFKWTKGIPAFHEMMFERDVQSLLLKDGEQEEGGRKLSKKALAKKEKSGYGTFKNCGCVLRMRGYGCNVTAKVFHTTGYIHITGARTMKTIQDAGTKIAKILKTEITDVSLQMVNVSFALPYTVCMSDMYEALRVNLSGLGSVLVMYDKDQHPGIKVVSVGGRGVAFLFRTGKVILTGFTKPEDFETHASLFMGAVLKQSNLLGSDDADADAEDEDEDDQEDKEKEEFKTAKTLVQMKNKEKEKNKREKEKKKGDDDILFDALDRLFAK